MPSPCTTRAASSRRAQTPIQTPRQPEHGIRSTLPASRARCRHPEQEASVAAHKACDAQRRSAANASALLKGRSATATSAKRRGQAARQIKRAPWPSWHPSRSNPRAVELLEHAACHLPMNAREAGLAGGCGRGGAAPRCAARLPPLRGTGFGPVRGCPSRVCVHVQ